MLGMEQLIELAAQIVAKPYLGEVFAETEPDAYEQVEKILRTPFFQFVPFGYYNDRYWGGYERLRSDTFEPNQPCQAGGLASHHRNKWFIAGNRAGKSFSGAYEDMCFLVGLDTITKSPVRRWNTPCQMWVVSDTEETSIRGMERIFYEDILGTDESGILWNLVDDRCRYSARNGWSNHTISLTNGANCFFKFSTQGRKSFQGVKLHRAHHDEVQPKLIWTETMARLVDNDGYFLGTMTPLDDRGLPWIYEELYLPRVAKDIEFHQWSMLDNPHLPIESKKRLMSTWDASEIEARVHGAFVPMGRKLAFSSDLLRACRAKIRTPEEGMLDIDDQGNYQFRRTA
jgi:hypothetical protein